MRIRQNMDYDATTNRFGGGIGLAAMLDPRYFVPYSGNAFYAMGWQIWYNDKTAVNAVEPPAQVKEALELYDEMKSTVDDARRVEAFKQILEIAADQFYSIGIKVPTTPTASCATTCTTCLTGCSNSFGYPLRRRPTPSSTSRPRAPTPLSSCPTGRGRFGAPPTSDPLLSCGTTDERDSHE